MRNRAAVVYYAWNRPEEVGAPLEVIENRFPALFESRRMLYPRFEEFGDHTRFDQGITGFLDHILKRNFAAFVEQAGAETGRPPVEVERVDGEGRPTPLDDSLLGPADTLVLISFDSLRTGQHPNPAEVSAVRRFLSQPDRLVFVCPHHDVGNTGGLDLQAGRHRQESDFLHHGDKTIPPQQGFGGFARSLLAALGVPVENRFGLHPAAAPDGSPAALEIESSLDRLHLLDGVSTFNLHPHLPHLERLEGALHRLDVLARQRVDLAAPAHPFTEAGRATFDALLQSRPDFFAGTLIVGDATLWSSTSGGLDSLRRLWSNVLRRP